MSQVLSNMEHFYTVEDSCLDRGKGLALFATWTPMSHAFSRSMAGFTALACLDYLKHVWRKSCVELPVGTLR